MADFSIYLLDPGPDGVGADIGRREITWLMKNQVGYAFSVGQVERFDAADPPALLEHADIDDGQLEELAGGIRGFARGEACYVAPTREPVDVERLAHRLAAMERIGVIEDPASPRDIEIVEDVGGFWSGASPPGYIEASGPAVEAVFNIAHPYSTGTVWDADEGQLSRLDQDGFEDVGTRPDGAVYTAIRTLDEGDVDQAVEAIERVDGHLASQYNLRVAEYNMKDEVDEGRLETRALSPSSVLVRVPGPDGPGSSGEAITSLVDRLDPLGISPAGHYELGADRVLLFKLHPRDSDLDDIGPGFDADHELRRLEQVEWARQSLPGFKFGAAGGGRVTVLDGFDGWTVSAEKPGIKDPSDFKVRIEGPELTETLDAQPEFVKIFSEAMWNLHCPESGKAFLEAVHRLWEATDSARELPEVIGALGDDLPPCTNDDELRYPRRAFLWMLAMLFVIEDVNYRFNFHPLPQFNPPLYRKQGRDQPMNAILQLGASEFSGDLAEDLGTRSINEGGTYARPRGFDGPAHLEGWYERNRVGG